MTHRHSRLKLAFQRRRFASPDRASEGHHDSALIERVNREELREIARQQRLHFLLLERAMQQLSSDGPDGDPADGAPGSAQSLPSAAARTALQHDLEAILLAALCDEPELDSSEAIVSPELTRGRGRSGSGRGGVSS